MLIKKQQFENLEIWGISIEIAEHVCKIADRLENLQLNKYSEYMKHICMRLSNHIAEVSGNHNQQNIKRSLTNAHLLALESENMIMILHEQQLLTASSKDSLLEKIQILGDMILEHQKTLKNNHVFT